MVRTFLETAIDRIGQDRHAEALRVLRRGLERMPADWRPIRRVGSWTHCSFWSAREFAEYLRIHPEQEPVRWARPSFSQALYWMSHCLWELDRPEEAEEAIVRGVQLEPDHPDSLCELAFFQQQRGAWEEALETFRAAGSRRDWPTPDQRALALRGQGSCLTELWDFDQAAVVLLESLRFEPGNRVAMGELQFLQRKREEVERQEGLSVRDRARAYPPVLAESKEMLRFAASVPAMSGAKTVGRENYERIRRGFESFGWLGFESEFISLYPGKDEETQRRKAQLMRDRLFRTAAGPDGTPGARTGRTRGDSGVPGFSIQ
jgi:tetratricopeptide (TPR) repeat protein